MAKRVYKSRTTAACAQPQWRIGITKLVRLCALELPFIVPYDPDAQIQHRQPIKGHFLFQGIDEKPLHYRADVRLVRKVL